MRSFCRTVLVAAAVRLAKSQGEEAALFKQLFLAWTGFVRMDRRSVLINLGHGFFGDRPGCFLIAQNRAAIWHMGWDATERENTAEATDRVCTSTKPK